MTVRLQSVDSSGFAPWVEAAVHVYVVALERRVEVTRVRIASTNDHLGEPGLRAVLALDDDQLVGFAYGFDDRPGQWWHDIVSSALDPDLTRRWLGDAFQITEVHVLPSHQRCGLGRRLVHTLLDGVTRRTVVLSAYDEPTPAMGLYASLGFLPLLTGFQFPGNAEVYSVLATELPLSQRATADSPVEK